MPPPRPAGPQRPLKCHRPRPGGRSDIVERQAAIVGDKLRLNCICQSVILLKKTAFLGVENSRFERE